ncbi:hypothetical protein A6A07_15440 [Streptomyces sp. CB03911]|nr:hypothetical protein A6A07_15440 [Streptomyces sp. CB03911]
MAADQSVDDGGPAVSAEPRPRSRFEEDWEETGFDLLPPPAEDRSTAPPTPADRRLRADPAHSASPPPVDTVATVAAAPRPRPRQTAHETPVTPRPTAVDTAPAAAPRPGPRQSMHEIAAPPRPSASAGGRDRPLGRRAETSRAVAPTLLAPPAGPAPTADAGEPAGRSTTPPAPAPGATPVAAPYPSAAARPLPPSLTEGAAAQVVGAASAATHDAPAAGAALPFEVVRADPLPLEPRPAADPPPEPAPVVVEIGRVEVRVVAEPPTTPARRPGPRIRTGPTLEDYLASGAGSGTERGAS